MNRKQALTHVFASLALGLVLAAGLNHNVFHPLNPIQNRPPQVVELLISAGTADKISRGIPAPADLPANMIFLTGDTLKVTNEDSIQHQLGPLVIPAGSSSSIVLKTAKTYSYLCTFQPTKYFGLDVRQPDTLATKLSTVLTSGLPLGVFIAMYGFVAFPKAERRPSPPS
jgi:hypothetical protein